MSSTPSIRPISQSWRSGCTGAKPTPQLPITTVVTPCQPDGVSSGSHVTWPSKWVWTSTNPGVTRAPSASIVCRAGPSTRPTSVTMPSVTATSAVRADGARAVDDGPPSHHQVVHRQPRQPSRSMMVTLAWPPPSHMVWSP